VGRGSAPLHPVKAISARAATPEDCVCTSCQILWPVAEIAASEIPRRSCGWRLYERRQDDATMTRFARARSDNCRA
jgi:hypothetical protein